jgi:hypothetical protein
VRSSLARSCAPTSSLPGGLADGVGRGRMTHHRRAAAERQCRDLDSLASSLASSSSCSPPRRTHRRVGTQVLERQDGERGARVGEPRQGGRLEAGEEQERSDDDDDRRNRQEREAFMREDGGPAVPRSRCPRALTDLRHFEK